MYEIHVSVDDEIQKAIKRRTGAFVRAHDWNLMTGAKSYYWELDGTNLAHEYGLNLVSYDVGAPVPLIRTIDVPGRPGKLDATLALNGRVNYISRPVSAVFHIRNNPYEDYHQILSRLLRRFNGTESRLEFSTDPRRYYKGRFLITPQKNGEVSSYITFSCEDAFPYKLEFEDIIVSVTDSKNVNLRGSDYNGEIYIYMETGAAMTATFHEISVDLAAGTNLVREFHLADGLNDLQFTGSGQVRIRYERGIL